MQSREIYGLIGLSMRSGQAAYGTEACEKGIKTGRIKLLIIDKGASNNTKRYFYSMCAKNAIQIIETGGGSPGKCIGRENIKIIGITGKDMAKNISEKYKEDSGRLISPS